MGFPGLTDAYDADYVGELISDMKSLGYAFIEADSYDGYLKFQSDLEGTTTFYSTSFVSWRDVEEWLRNI